MYTSSPACPYLMCECFLHQSCYQTDFNKSLLLSSFCSNKLNIWDHKHNINFICGSLCRQSGCWWLFSEGLFLLFLLICLWFGTYAKCSSLKSQLVSPWYPVWPYYLPPLSILGTDLVSFRGNSVQLLPSQGFQHIPSKRNFTRLHQNCLAWSSCVENPYSFTNCYHHTLSRFPQYSWPQLPFHSGSGFAPVNIFTDMANTTPILELPLFCQVPSLRKQQL